MKPSSFLILMLFTIVQLNKTIAQKPNFPGKSWQQFVDPADAGFDKTGLDSLSAALESLKSDGFLAVVDGKIAFEWGETTRRFMQASVRKSYMNAAFGIYVGKDKINIHSTLAELDIDDLQPLSEVEKRATVLDLLGSRSGIYHPAAFSPQSMIENLPERHLDKPGENWFYNNWDFNTLATVFNRQTGKDFFEVFYQEIAQPLQMENFRLFDTYYRMEEAVSQHPAYLFKMSAQDMARFGLLYLNKGNWEGKQIVPENWIEKSTAPVTKNLPPRYESYGSYGLLWWVSEVNGEPVFYASGSGTQRIYVMPSRNIVAVHVVDSYQNKYVDGDAVHHLMELLLKAKISEPKANAKFIDYNPIGQQVTYGEINSEVAESFLGTYQDPFLGKIEFQKRGKEFIAHTRVGYFRLLAITEQTFWIEDFDVKAIFQKGTAEQKNTSKAQVNKNRMVEAVMFYY